MASRKHAQPSRGEQDQGAPALIRMQDIFKPMLFNGGIDFGLPYLEQGLKTFALDMEPPYQRGHVWTDEQRVAFMGHMLTGGPVQPLIWNEVKLSNVLGSHFEVLDGLQRLTTILRWLRNELPADIGDGRLVYRRDTDQMFRMMLDVRVSFTNLGPVEVLEYYLRLNSGGTPHSPEALDKVRRMLAAQRVQDSGT